MRALFLLRWVPDSARARELLVTDTPYPHCSQVVVWVDPLDGTREFTEGECRHLEPEKAMLAVRVCLCLERREGSVRHLHVSVL